MTERESVIYFNRNFLKKLPCPGFCRGTVIFSPGWSDPRGNASAGRRAYFEPGIPRGRLGRHSHRHHPERISIRAPRAGSDWPGPQVPSRRCHFNPHSPCGQRPPVWRHIPCQRANFNPRSPCGERQIGTVLYAGPEDCRFSSPRGGNQVLQPAPQPFYGGAVLCPAAAC